LGTDSAQRAERKAFCCILPSAALYAMRFALFAAAVKKLSSALGCENLRLINQTQLGFFSRLLQVDRVGVGQISLQAIIPGG